MTWTRHNTLLNLQDGDKATIAPRHNGGKKYRLQRRQTIHKYDDAYIFSCRISTLPNKPVAAKIFSPGDTVRTARIWKREKIALGNLNHENIIKLLDFDGRVVTLYLAEPPLSLDHENQLPFSPLSALRVLQNISTALAYLTTKDVVHNDIRPANIAYAINRGAILINFEASSPALIPADWRPGTCWYIPPEYLTQHSRGFAGDIWALGVTMLYILGKIPLPESSGDYWLFHKAFKEYDDHRDKMVSWLKRVTSIGEQMSQQDKIQSLVLQMIQTVDSRVKAAELQLEAAAISLEP
ncbi:kinase-like domain-containing protein [Trichoderma chlorosporum]